MSDRPGNATAPLVKALAGVSFGLGISELLAPRKVAALAGVEPRCWPVPPARYRATSSEKPPRPCSASRTTSVNDDLRRMKQILGAEQSSTRETR